MNSCIEGGIVNHTVGPNILGPRLVLIIALTQALQCLKTVDETSEAVELTRCN